MATEHWKCMRVLSKIKTPTDPPQSLYPIFSRYCSGRHSGKRGYRIALIARCVQPLQAAVGEINGYEGGEAVAFAVKQYKKAEVSRVFEEIKVKWPGAVIRDAIHNIAHRISRPFLQLTQQNTGKLSTGPGAVASLLSGLPFALG
ncbi:uncharacterized protein EI90DRAFT_3028510 [Cantharellus anzutake]|uniref:uncharacterized protein n=1 Tax=Cantharellus anzutake TaxID=1750568 RepID=UPI0019060A25|nr:uncharacterized protein EI90DRAFT_3028510 [Cantharellus anzutake]KAF8344172.1 hypothetical protein EI90DRAFT_3028510 [Cantharellus anzutake]